MAFETMLYVLTMSVKDVDFFPPTDQTKHYDIGNCCFPNNHAELRSKNKSWLTQESWYCEYYENDGHQFHQY
jgi:hypothetical protein